MNVKYTSILILSIFANNIDASVSPCTPVYPFVQKNIDSNILIESTPWSPNINIRQGATRVYKGEKLLYDLDFYLYNEYAITDSTGVNLVILDRYGLDYYKDGNLINRLTSYHILTKKTRDSLREKYRGITDVSDSYFLDHSIQVCEIAKTIGKKIKLQVNPNDLFVNGNNLFFRTIENKWVAFNLISGEIKNNQNPKRLKLNSLDVQRNYKLVKYPNLKNTKTVEGNFLNEVIAHKLNMEVATWESDDLKLIFDISIDKTGVILSQSKLNFFFSTNKMIMDEIELRKEELNKLIQTQKLEVKVPKELPEFHMELELYLKKATNNR